MGTAAVVTVMMRRTTDLASTHSLHWRWLLPRILELSRLTSVHRARQYSNSDCSEEEEIMDIEG